MNRHQPALLTPVVAATLALTAPATAQLLDYEPLTAEVRLNTDSTTVVPTSGPPITVVGGVFAFRSVRIRAGVNVFADGSRPMIWIVDDMVVDGMLSVSGGTGQSADNANPATQPLAGGLGGPAAGDGGAGSPRATARSFQGQAGEGPGGAPGRGGTGGNFAATVLGPTRGSGGAGGAFATTGDPGLPFVYAGGTSFVQQLGLGGFGGPGASGAATRTVPGGFPQGAPFFDGTADNDFFGVAFDVFRRRFVSGELPFLVGGAGGGGGGDLGNNLLPGDPGFVNDRPGGAGGGGGGCLVIYARNSLVVGPTGRIEANGGAGGGGADNGACDFAGGGGGGSGGMIVLVSETTIDLAVQGETWALGDAQFCLSAIGGQGRAGGFAPNSPAAYDAVPRGGIGGLGIIQLVTRPGNNGDGTNTLLDDNVVLRQNGVVLTGATKQRFLGWRGFDNGQGVLVDDNGAPTNVGHGDGDMRPAPVLMPLFR